MGLTSRLPRAFAAVNVLALVVLLATKTPEYERLRAEDRARESGEIQFFESEAPFYVAARPLYAGQLVFGVPVLEEVYVFVNVPAMLVSLVISLPLASISAKLATGSYQASSVWASWVSAGTLAVAVALWGFIVGVVVDQVRRLRDRAA